MERIILELDNAAAQKWRHASMEKKDQISRGIEKLINKALSQSDDDFWDFVERMNKKAADNGLTEEILNDLLNEK